jgi:protein-disulfide isomerase
MRLAALSVAASLALAPLPLHAQGMTEAEVKALALEAILERPEIVMEAIGILQEHERLAAEAAARAAIEANRPALESGDNAPVLGNPDGDVTVVEFFDYNCPYCRRAGPEVAGLLEADQGVRLVYREYPILGEGSVFAARAALAARAQDGYEAMHAALMGAQGRLDERSVMQVAAELGLDADRLRADMEGPEVMAHIRTSLELAHALGVNGTPAFVVGDVVAPGLVETAELQAMVAAARGEETPMDGGAGD